ncbi:FtsW/RodA/SpoVE family cell cycle protein [Megasphaera hexanoica]|uniref:Probable peptidoglycan glycosyltransferase FtsW n=2 Tax=Megasphaera TaxID=906 RepID=A0A848BZ84_9FIRM|nr:MULTISPECIES: putative peptidoglycan glycosyltransferase FtsW [Megasphaera]AXB81502.1 cell division protein FtsW [Megasphaera hexanoica]MCI5532172.1 putative lipid II flippase FtsW [Caecibacter massiliensis]MDY2903712.1 putative peptidoglycan glycosyltransferase FtsW [Caecibacter massiliensis]NME27653.1 cell division protein FtsW [Megasphaera hexanoica]
MNPHTKEMRRNFWMLLIAFFLLIIIGTSNVFSSTFVEDMAEGGSAYGHLIRQGVYLSLGLVPALFVYKKDYHMWKKWSVRLFVFTVILLVAVLAAGIVVNGARRWLGAGGFTFQPSEIAKLVVILFTADKLAPLWDKKGHIEFFSPLSAFFPSQTGKEPRWKRIRFVPHPLLLPPLLLGILVFRQPDAGTALVILFLPLVMFWVSGASILKAKVPLLATLAVGIVYLLSAPYRMNRIISWYDPWSYEKTLGYQTVQGLIAIGSGGIMGQGLGEGISKFSYLPEAHTDFAFAVLAQEWGMRGSIFMLVLFSMIIYFGCNCAWNTRDTFGKLLTVGITMYFGGQGMINLAMVSGILPVVGVPLPFISYGGTSLLLNMIAAALLLNIAHRNYREAVIDARLREQPALHSMKEETRSRFPLR